MSTVLSYALIVLVTFATSSWLQAINIFSERKNPSVLSGVSPNSVFLCFTAGFLWLVYGASRGLVGAVSNAVLECICAGTIIAILALGGFVGKKRGAIYILIAALVLTMALLFPLMSGILATCIGASFLIPQAVLTVRSIGTPAINGFAWTSVAMVLTANPVWIVYAVINHDAIIAISSFILFTCGVVMATSKLVHKKRYADNVHNVSIAEIA